MDLKAEQFTTHKIVVFSPNSRRQGSSSMAEWSILPLWNSGNTVTPADNSGQPCLLQLVLARPEAAQSGAAPRPEAQN
jgi:hypothetical protein